MKSNETKSVRIDNENFAYDYFSETKEYRIFYKVDQKGYVCETRIKKRESSTLDNFLVV